MDELDEMEVHELLAMSVRCNICGLSLYGCGILRALGDACCDRCSHEACSAVRGVSHDD
jgi:hypothetical protein